MSPKWGPKTKGMTIIQGKDNATPTKNSDEKLPRVVGGMKAITVREVRDKKYSRDIGTAHSPPIMSADESRESVYKPIHTGNTLCSNTFNPNTPMQATSRDSPR